MAQYDYFTFTYPGASNTGGLGINDAGEVVGSFTGMGGLSPSSFGYTYQNAAFSIVSYPTSPTTGETTKIVGISGAGLLVGTTSSLATNSNSQAFTDSNGIFSPLPDPPGSNNVFPAGIDPSGTTIVGSYQEGRYDVGFTFTNGTYTNIAYPGYGTSNTFANSVAVNGINAAGTLVGSYGYLGGTQNGFLDVKGVFSTIDYPSGASTSANGINTAGEIVGSYTDAAGASHGFVDNGGTFASVDVAGATSTFVNGVNDEGVLVGTAVINGADVAFTASPVCFVLGTLIRTAQGDRAVETLARGDLVVTRSGEHRPIRWLGHRTLDCRRHSRPHEIMPVRIVAHAFGEGCPARDLNLSPGHAVCVDVVGEVLIPAWALVNGATVTQENVDTVTYWHVELDSHDVLYAENLPCESYLEMGNRAFFVEADATTLHAEPDAPMLTHSAFCRPFLQEGSIVEFVQGQLIARAAALGWTLHEPPLADHLHLLVDGVRVTAEASALSARFLVPADATTVWLVSQTDVPALIGHVGDQREVGVCIGALTINDGFVAPRVIPADDPTLCVGFHAVEHGPQRWTSGRASLPRILWSGYEAGFFLRIDLTRPPLPRWQRTVAPPYRAIPPSARGSGIC